MANIRFGGILAAITVLSSGLAGCSNSHPAPQAESTHQNSAQRQYFADPQSAVPVISRMLATEDWKTLASYYDVPADSPERANLESGDAFISKAPPGSPQSAQFDRYIQPFPPEFHFISTRQTDNPGLVEVTVAREIDQGGGMVQRVTRTFMMRKSENGFQLILVPNEKASSP
jgi:hypothetical protein